MLVLGGVLRRSSEVTDFCVEHSGDVAEAGLDAEKQPAAKVTDCLHTPGGLGA